MVSSRCRFLFRLSTFPLTIPPQLHGSVCTSRTTLICTAKFLGDPESGLDQLVDVTGNFKTGVLQRVHDVLRCDVPGCARRVGTPAQTGNRGIEGSKSRRQRSKDVCEGRAKGVVELSENG